MKQYKVTNLSQGRLEIKEIKKTLDGGGWAIVAEPLPESIRLRMGGGKRRLLDVVEILPESPKAAPKPAAPPAPSDGGKPAKNKN